MHEAALSLAALPAPTVIGGITLRPYSLGHELCLIRTGNPFLVPAAVTCLPIAQQHEALLSAMWTCANTWEENRTSAHQWLGPLKSSLLARRFKQSDIAECVQQFLDYREQGCAQFRLSEIPRPVDRNAGSRRTPGSPLILMVFLFLVEHLRLTETQSWDYPAGKAYMLWQTYWEQEGGLDIYNAQDAKFDAYRERREREKREAKEKGTK